MGLVHGNTSAAGNPLVPLLLAADGSVIVSTLPALPAGSNLIGRVDGRLGNGLIGFSSTLQLTASNLNAAIGNNTVTTSAVPAGEIWHVEGIIALNNTSATTQELIELDASGINFQVLKGVGAAAAFALTFTGAFTLAPGDSVSAVFSGCTLGDDLFVKVWGWKQLI